jgi:hypothetical protein
MEAALYMSFIQKLVNKHVRNPEHIAFREDIQNESFIKLLKNEFIENNKLSSASKAEKKEISAYVARTVKSSYLDFLSKHKITKKMTENERADSGQKYKKYDYCEIDDSENGYTEPALFSHEERMFAETAYKKIMDCFSSALAKVGDETKKAFLTAVYWDHNSYGLSTKQLAQHFNYRSSNPTQELNRFTEKVSLCTKTIGVVIDSPQEQIMYLHEIFESAEI